MSKSVRNIAIAGLSLLLLYSCGSDDDSPNQPAAPTLFGTVFLGTRVDGANITVEDLDGNILARAVSDVSGDFLITASLPSDFRVLARVAGSTLDFGAEVRGANGRRRVVINIPTTLASTLVRTQRVASLAEAEALVRSGLAIPAGLDLGDGLDESPTSSFSHLAFLAVAGENGGLQSYSARVIDELDTNPTAFLLSPSVLRTPIAGLEPGLQELVEDARRSLTDSVRFAEAPAAPSLELLMLPYSTPGSFGYGVWQGITGNLITGLPGAVSSVLGLIFNQLGLNFTTSGKLEQIQETLNAIQSELDALQMQLSEDSLQQTEADLDSATLPITTTFTNYTAGVNAAAVPGATNVPIGVNGGPLTSPGAATGLASFSTGANGGEDLTTYLATIGTFTGTPGNLPNQPNVIAKSFALLAPRYGLDQKARTFNLPLRSNKLIAQAQTQVGVYRAIQLQGLTMLAENVHTYSNEIPDPVNDTYLVGEAAIKQQQQLYLNLKKQAQQVPIELPRGDIIVDLEFGIMWYDALIGGKTWKEAQDYATNFRIQGTGADGTTVVYDDWRLPTYAECRALQYRGRYNPHADTSDPTLPFNTNNGFPDTGFTTNGLAALGFQMGDKQQNPWPSTSTAQDGEIFYNAWVYSHSSQLAPYGVWTINYPIIKDGIYQQEVPPSGANVFRLNHETNNVATTSGVRPFFLVRSIAVDNPNNENDVKTVLSWDDGDDVTDSLESRDHDMTTPFVSPGPYNALGSDTGLPEPVQTGEFPILGVVTALTPPTAVPAPQSERGLGPIPAGSLQLATGLTYQISLGGSVTLGKLNESGKSTTLSLDSRVFTNSNPIKTVDSNNLPNPLADLVGFSSDASHVAILNVPGPLPTQTQVAAGEATGAIGLQGILIPYSTAPATVTVQLLAPAGDTSTFNNITASAAITPPAAADHSLMNLQILPRNIALGAGSTSSPYNLLSTVGMAAEGLPLSLTAYYADGTAGILGTSATNQPANTSVVWTITPAEAQTQLNAFVSVIGNTVTLNYDATGLPDGATVSFDVTASYQGASDTAAFSVSKP